MTKDELQLFRFRCPECGISDEELGHLVAHDDAHCMVCFMDDGRIVRLRRWADPEVAKDASPTPVKRACG